MKKIIIAMVSFVLMAGSVHANWSCTSYSTVGTGGYGISHDLATAKEIALRECSKHSPWGSFCYRSSVSCIQSPITHHRFFF
jgi:hypothetical protein